MAALVAAAVVLLIVLTIVWGVAAGEHDRIERARDRAFMHELRHVRGEDESPY